MCSKITLMTYIKPKFGSNKEFTNFIKTYSLLPFIIVFLK